MAIKVFIFSGLLLLASIVSAGNVTLGDRSEGKLLYHQTFEKMPKPGVTETGIGRINVKDGVITAIDIQDLQGDGRSIVLSGGVGENSTKIALIGERGTGFKFVIDVYGKLVDKISKLDESSKDESVKPDGPKLKMDNPDEASKDKSENPDESEDKSDKPDEPSNDKSKKPDEPSKDKSEKPDEESKDGLEKPDEPSKDKSKTPDEPKDKSDKPEEPSTDKSKKPDEPSKDKSEKPDEESKDKLEKPDETSKDKSEKPDEASKDKSSDTLNLVYTPAEASK